MRKDCISRDIRSIIFDQAEFAVVFKPQETHEERTASELNINKMYTSGVVEEGQLC